MKRWKIYYSDGSTYSSTDGSIKDSPGGGVQVITTIDDAVGKILLARQDFYWWTGEEWLGGDVFGLALYILHHVGWQKILLGELMSYSKYKAIYNIAYEDQSMPHKSAWYKWEFRPPWLKDD